jgi:hypothetical protein
MSNLVLEWKVAAKNLGFDIVFPYRAALPSGARIDAELLVVGFGASKGMLIVRNFPDVAAFGDELDRVGYGCCVFEEPEKVREFSRKDFIDVLSDWGWSGHPDKKPGWLKDVEISEDGG